MNKEIEFTQELHQNFIDFAYEANSQRAFADARDGLKPGQRACLWEMYDKGYVSNKPHVKSAKISGGVIANWWPHGDTAIYDTFARMSQKWINNIPEVDWHGANGSQIISGEAAASRYTEARLSKAVEEGMLFNIKKHNVPMIKNFSEDAEWPEVLPAILPRLMINGCQGIGVTIANVWLPHNLKDLWNSIMDYLETGKVSTDNLYPDFPSGGIIINQSDIHTIYETGKGKVILRAKTTIEKNSIFITEFPYQVYVEPWIESVKKLIEDGTLNDIENIYNRSSHKGILVEIECSSAPERILNKLFEKTDLQKSYNANQFALVGKTPKLLTLKEYYDIYINHNLTCIIKENEFDLAKAKNRKEIVDGLLLAIKNIDEIIALIKSSSSSSVAKDALIEKYDFTENQAKAIIEMKLGRLAHLEGIELNKEQHNLIETIENCNNIISHKEKQIKVFKDRFASLMRKYGTFRKTEVQNIEITKEEKRKIEIIPEDVVVILNGDDKIKRIPKKNFKVQHKKGVGVKSLDNVVKNVISTSTINSLMLFTSEGKMYKIEVDKIPEGTNVSKGTDLKVLLPFSPNETVQAILPVDNEIATNVVFFTEKGLIKKTKIEEYTSTKRKNGIQAIKIKDGDKIIRVAFMSDDENVILITQNGNAIRIPTDDIKPIGRLTSGVKGIDLKEDDKVVSALIVSSKEDEMIVATRAGKSKRMTLNNFIIQGRGGRGVSCIKLEQGDYIAAAALSPLDASLLIVGRPNSICIPVAEISSQTRNGMGTKIIERSEIQSITRL